MSKYFVEKHYPVWFVFGQRPDGTVDINDGTNDVLVKVPKDGADQIIEAHNKVVSLVETLVQQRRECIPFGL